MTFSLRSLLFLVFSIALFLSFCRLFQSSIWFLDSFSVVVAVFATTLVLQPLLLLLVMHAIRKFPAEEVLAERQLIRRTLTWGMAVHGTLLLVVAAVLASRQHAVVLVLLALVTLYAASFAAVAVMYREIHLSAVRNKPHSGTFYLLWQLTMFNLLSPFTFPFCALLWRLASGARMTAIE